jgi:hypothetical protein
LHPILCLMIVYIGHSTQRNSIFKIKTKRYYCITIVYLLCYMFRPFLGNHQASYKKHFLNWVVLLRMHILRSVIIIIDFSLFGVCPSNKHCPSARCAYAANAGVKISTYLQLQPFLCHIYIHEPKIVNNIC